MPERTELKERIKALLTDIGDNYDPELITICARAAKGLGETAPKFYFVQRAVGDKWETKVFEFLVEYEAAKAWQADNDGGAVFMTF